ncbi:MAG: TIGR01777 family oxidoreductase [Chitinophagales bacterium]|nr:TIGR01777 family oxidoreductase [Chitinophagales bacterium]
MKNILISGGSGLIGSHLTKLLQQRGHKVAHLSRQKAQGSITAYHWDPARDEIDDACISEADYIIHMAGANVGNHRWTNSYKAEILQSRIRSTELLYTALQRTPNKVKAIIASSATGYYGSRGDEWLKEDAQAGDDFLATTCLQWEQAVNRIASLNKRVVSLRTGIVLAVEGGALPRLVMPVRFGIAPVFGNGLPFYPWIHIADLCGIYLHALDDETMQGAFNAVSPSPERYMILLNSIAKALKRKKLNIPVPSFALQLALGGFAQTLTMSTRCSAEKIAGRGFVFHFPSLEAALQDLIGKK